MSKAAQDPAFIPRHGRSIWGGLYPKHPEMPPEVHALVNALERMPNQLRQVLADHQWSSIALDVKEKAQHPNLVANQVLFVPRAFDTLVRITTVLVILPGTATGGTLILGDNTIPLVNNPFLLTPVNFDLSSNDARSVVYTGGGPGAAYVLLTGQQLPTYGLMGG